MYIPVILLYQTKKTDSKNRSTVHHLLRVPPNLLGGTQHVLKLTRVIVPSHIGECVKSPPIYLEAINIGFEIDLSLSKARSMRQHKLSATHNTSLMSSYPEAMKYGTRT